MYYVYVIKSLSRHYLYVGLTSSITRRFKEHNIGKEKTTKPYRPFMLLHLEQHPDRATARLREIYLKSGAGREYIKRKFLVD